EAEWTNAYVGLALILAEKAGADVPTSAISALCDRLERDLRGVPDEKTSVERLESACQALWVLALADRRPVAYVNKLRDRMSDLSPRARAFLALAANACNADGDPA